MVSADSSAARTALWRSGALLAALVVLAVMGPIGWQLLTGDTVVAQHLELGAVPPSLRHPLGTDFFGRDLLVRNLWGLRMSLGVGLCAALTACALGTLVGAISGYLGGLTDALLMRLVDVLYTLPFMFVVIVLVTLVGRSLLLLFIALGLVGWLSTARLVRGHVLSLRQREFVVAVQALGASDTRVVLRHLLPHLVPTVVLSFTLAVPSMVLEEAFLSFLGLGVQAPTPSLGSLINEGANAMLVAPWQLWGPALLLALLLVGLNAVGEALRAWAPGASAS